MRRKRSIHQRKPVARARVPVVERVAPELAVARVRVRRDARDAAVLEELRVGAVVGAAGRDVDRQVADQAHAALGRVARAARPTRARSAPGRRSPRRPRSAAQSPIQNGCRATNDSISSGVDRRARLGEQPAPGRERRRAHVRRAELVRRRRAAGPATTTGPAACSQSTNRYASGAEPAAGERGRDAAGSRRSAVASPGLVSPFSRKDTYAWPRPRTKRPPARIQIQDVSPQVDCGRYPFKRTVGDRVDVRARRSSATATRRSAPRCAGSRAPESNAGGESPLHAGRQRLVGGLVHRRRVRPLVLPRRGVGRPRSRRGRSRLRRKVGRGPGGPRRASSPRARCVLGARARSRSRRGSAAPRRRPQREDVVGRRSTSTSTASARASAPGTSSSRARGAASSGVEEVLPQLAELGFDVVYLPPIHPIGAHEPQGAEQRAERRAGRRRQPVGDRRRRGRPQRDPPGARHGQGLRARSSRRGRELGSRSASTSRSSARPTTRGCRSIRSGSTAARTGRSSTPRTRPSATRTSTTSTSTATDWQALWEALRGVVLLLGRARRALLPRRQPAHEAGRRSGSG